MEHVMTLMRWQLFFKLNLCRQKKDIEIPTLDELKRMKKEVYRRFRQGLRNLTHYNRNLRA